MSPLESHNLSIVGEPHYQLGAVIFDDCGPVGPTGQCPRCICPVPVCVDPVCCYSNCLSYWPCSCKARSSSTYLGLEYLWCTTDLYLGTFISGPLSLRAQLCSVPDCCSAVITAHHQAIRTVDIAPNFALQDCVSGAPQ